MIVLADKLVTFGVVYLALFSLSQYNDLHQAFKFMFGSKDMFVYSFLLLTSASNWLKIAYLISGIINLSIYVSFYVFDYGTYREIYGSFVYIVQFISASQLIGIWSNGGYHNDDGGNFIFSGIRHGCYIQNQQVQK